MSFISKNNVIETLKTVGLNRGEICYVHSDLKKIGFKKDTNGNFQLALSPDLLFDAFQSVLGESGTLVAPAFTSGRFKEKIFSVPHTKSLMGAFSECIRKKNFSFRSLHPLLSITAAGKKAEYIARNIGNSGFGSTSPYEKLFELDAKLLIIGVPYCSFKDYVECVFNVPYRYKKYFRSKIEDGQKRFVDIYEHDVQYLNQDVENVPFYSLLKEQDKNKIQSTTLGSAIVHCIGCRNAYDLMRKKLKENPFAFLRRTPLNAGAMSLIQEISTGLMKGEHEIKLKLFAIDENGVEKWNWYISHSNLLHKRILNYINLNALENAKSWWSTLIPEGSEYVLSTGTKEQPGAEIALQVMNDISKENSTENIPVLKEKFISALTEYNPMVYKLN